MTTIQENGQRRRAEEMFPLMEKYERSDKTQQAFCSEHGLEVHVLNYWVGKYRKEKGGSAESDGGFISLEVEPPEPMSQPSAAIEIVYPNGRVIRFYDGVKPAYLKALVL